MTTPLEAARQAQAAAADPAVSAFVAASAGSGKTKLLTDRLLRLLLAGTPPARILCLTYTKAAAAEMAIRLHLRLGRWVVLADAALEAELRGLDVAVSPASRLLARQLFADVLDLPGGMRIGTIHAFCQSLLRRFPLEAGLSPHFQLADDGEAAARLREARERVLADPARQDAIGALAAVTDEQSFATLSGEFADGEHDMRTLLQGGVERVTAMQRAALAAGEHDHDEVLRNAVAWEREHHVGAALRQLHDQGSKWGQKYALQNLTWLAHEAEERVLNWVQWVEGHFTGGKPRSLDRLFKANMPARDALHAEITAEHRRIERVEDARKAAVLCEVNSNLTRLIAPILAAEASAKQAAGLLSYGDLISRTGALLQDPGAAWILYKLDGGIDHLLLDEVQDTAPAQWEIADAIAAEFFAGEGARDVKRSIFAVGDAKQSIFSFQGADLRSFATYRDKFRARVQAAGHAWLDGRLDVSFRSTAPVLALVDAVFAAGPAQDGVCRAGEVLRHGVSRAGQAGAVSLWPLVEATPPPALPDWAVPDDYAGAASATALLARRIAAHIKAMLDGAVLLPSRGRAVAAGDFLILVRRRDGLVSAITAAAKALGLPIAGADRMVLTAQQAVSDLLAFCDALLLPADDLAFGQYLASPLGGLGDASLQALAVGRRGTLAQALFARRAEQAEWAQAAALFETLRAKVDFITPHDLLAALLGPHGGRAKLLARLGAQAAEPIDELLEEALAHGRRAPASLQSFVHELRHANATIKREADASGDVIRIMTVHGAKGLQAPIVILPDTTQLPKHGETLFWLAPPQQPDVLVPLFCPAVDMRCTAVAEADAAKRAADLQEHNRLLYVALTRAEDELIICGAKGSQALAAECWYALAAAGFARLGAVATADGGLLFAAVQAAAPDRAQRRAAVAPAALPAWAGAAPDWRPSPPPAETTRPEPLAPSRNTEDAAKRAVAASPLGLGGVAAAAAARAAALAKGKAVHELLQHLPALAASARAAAARRYLARATPGDPALAATVLAAVLGIIDDPALVDLFGPGSRAEVPLAGVVGEVEIGGLVDRLAVLADRVLLADYKTDRAPPEDAAAVPVAYLRQLAAYQAIIAQIYPGREIICLLIFTETAAVITLPAALLAGHAPRPAQPYAP